MIVNADTFWSLDDEQRYQLLRPFNMADIATCIEKAASVIRLESKDDCDIRPTSLALEKFLGFANSHVRDDKHFERMINSWDWRDSIAERLLQVSRLYEHDTFANLQIRQLAHRFRIQNELCIDRIIDTILVDVSNQDLNWDKHADAFSRICAHPRDVVILDPYLITKVLESKHASHIWNLIINTRLRTSSSLASLPHVLCESIYDETNSFSWKSFVWLFSLTLLDRRLDRKERLQYKRERVERLESSCDFEINDYINQNVYAFLARIPQADKVYVEQLVLMLTYLWDALEWHYIGGEEKFISGQPGFRLKCNTETRTELIRYMSDKNIGQLLELALHHPERFKALWEELRNKGLVINEDELRDYFSVKPMLRALRYSGSETNSVFFKQKIFWNS
jgi:hypothetical protein